MAIILLLATLGVLILSAGQAISHRNRDSAYSKTRQQAVDLFERIRLASVGVDSCTRMLNGTALTPGGTTALTSLNLGSDPVSIGTTRSVTIRRISLIDGIALPQTYDSAGMLRDHRRVRLEIAGDLVNESRTLEFVKSYAMDVLLDAGNSVLGCYRGQNAEKVACEVMGGTYSNAPVGCQMPANGQTSGACPSGQCMIGFDDSNRIVCRAL